MTRCSFAVSAAALVCAVASNAHAQGAANNPHLRLTQQYNWTFSEIGDVGNAPAIVDNWRPSVKHPGDTRPVGSVGYRYRVATTEVTWGQYHEFVQAYGAVMSDNFRLGIVSEDWIVPNVPNNSPLTFIGAPGGQAMYSLDPARADQPATSSWRLFARMVNWLHNGAPSVEVAISSDFESGVYDTSTFARISDGPTGAYYTDQDSRAPGARFWIPSIDELTKATFYDPNKDGQGNAGYWGWGNSSDTQPTPGDPALGGETNAGAQVQGNVQWPEGQFRPLDVGSYPDEQSPWGLLDGAGGGREWTETWREGGEDFEQNSRLAMAAGAFRLIERGFLGDVESGFPPNNFYTLRLAAAIPSPGGAAVFALSALLAARRRR